MLFALTVVNYADRSTLSITGTEVAKDLALDAVAMGFVFSAFGWTYAIGQIPGGWLLDRYGSKAVYGLSLLGWSLLTFLQGSSGFFGVALAVYIMFALRFLLGLVESPAFPANGRIVAAWFPTAERGTATAVFNSAQYFATVLFAPIMGWITHALGWQYVFYFMGVIGFILAAIWFKVVHSPKEHPRISRSELDYIERGGALVNMDEKKAATSASSGPQWSDLKQLLTNRMLLGIYIGQYCITPPVVLASLEAGLGANGVSINRAGTLALVANRSEGTVSVFTISGKTVTPAGKVQLGDPKSSPSHVVFTPDGRRALVTRDGDHRISVLSIEGSKVEYTKRDMVAGVRPYSLDVSAKGDIAVNGNQGGGMGDADTVSVIDLKAEPPRVVNTVSVGQTPEGVYLSPDGAYLAVNSINGSHKPKDSPFFNDFGLLKIYRVTGTELTFVTQAKVGHWGQGIAWSKNGRTLLYQATAERELQVLSFDGRELKLTGAIKLSAGPVGLRTADQ